MTKIGIRYALFCGIFLFVIFALLDFFGSQPLLNLNLLILDILVFSIFIFFAIREFKVFNNNAILHYWQGLKIGSIVFLLASMICTLILFVYISVQDDYIANYKSTLVERAELSKAELVSEFGMDGFITIKESILKLTFQEILVTGISPPSILLKKVLTGFFIAPLISIILRKKPT